jgi:hypothetical protein
MPITEKSMAISTGGAMIERPGTKFLPVKGFPKNTHIVSMITWKGKLMVATTGAVYEIRDNKATKLKLKEADNAHHD